MSDSDFPSGPWTGFFNYRAGGRRHRTDLSLSFANGRMTGDGTDGVGPFIVSGHYDAASRECRWTKSYLGAHDVLYEGVREGKGIWGTWEIRRGWRGGFHIWPLGEAVSETLEEHVEETFPAEPVHVGAPG